MRTLPLSATAITNLDINGNGQVQVGPVNPRETWYPTSVSISTNEASPSGSTPRCFIYCGPLASQQFFVDGTYAVQAAASSLITGQTVYIGNYIWAVVTGGPPGAQFAMVVQGSRDTP